jgi:putative transposase
MTYNNRVLSKLLKLLPRHEFEKQANRVDGRRRSNALSRGSQFVALTIGQSGGCRSLRDIEATIHCQKHHSYHLGNQLISHESGE